MMPSDAAAAGLGAAQFVRPAFAASLECAHLIVSHLTLQRSLGAGSIGRVELFLDPGTGVRYAIKTIPINSASTEERARKEAEVVRALGDHACVPAYLAALYDERCTCLRLVMEYVEGACLMDAIRASGGLPEAAVQCLLRQLISALDHVQRRGYVYVDLKPENVLLVLAKGCGRNSLGSTSAAKVMVDNLATGGTRVMLCDFDLCHRLAVPASASPPGASASAAGTSTGSSARTPTDSRQDGQGGRPFFWGTLDSVAPEVIAHGVSGYGTPSDWWAVGVLTFECLFGYSPFATPSQERTIYNITMTAPWFPDQPKVSDKCQQFVRCLLRQRVDVRMGSRRGAQELLEHSFLKLQEGGATGLHL
ncbi:hypothetical protein FOA52_003113 [Chlamydomonas sp. UWO 241]|nr:hypothetical protein FOA52_003113 [Chlamydomonas sp. UWO 241]